MHRQRARTAINETVEIATMSSTLGYNSGPTTISPAESFTLGVNNQFYSYDLAASADGYTSIGTVVIRYTVTSPLP